ncbi:MAG TPA: carboxypeptidase regulatory-like domain-containing protein [Planctomycetes bacterium]|nr:carboxypeptidase regulatory-like domain-containing protein [Planctomycetota bacterium]HIL36171.1 carboxypeptidase regulatory-like domain-containing protein [Planctomycetota bacterium]
MGRYLCMKQVFVFVSILAALALVGILGLKGIGLVRSLVGGVKVVEEPLQVSFDPLEGPVLDELVGVPEARVVEAAASGEVPEDADDAAPRSIGLLRFVDPDGFPVSGVKVNFYRQESGAVLSDSMGKALVRSEGDPKHPFRNHGLSYSHPDFADGAIGGNLSPGVETDFGEVILKPAGSVEVIVLDPTGAPFEGARVQWSTFGAFDQRLEKLERQQVSATAQLLEGSRMRISQGGNDSQAYNFEEIALTNARGLTRLHKIPEGEIRLWAGGGEHQVVWSPSVEIRRGMLTHDVVLTLGVLNREDFIRVTIVDPNGDPIGLARLESEYSSMMGSGSGSTTVNNEGVAVIGYRPRQPRDLHATDGKGRYGDASRKGVVGGEEVVLQLSEPAFMELHITTESGILDGLKVSIYDAESGEHLTFMRNLQPGASTQRLSLPSEDFVLRVSASGHEELEVGPFKGRAAPKETSIHLGAIPGVRGLVLAAGRPVKGASVELYKLSENRRTVNGFPSRVISSPSTSGTTDASGAFALTLRASGHYYLRVEAEGYAPGEQGPFQIDADEGLGDLQVDLSAGGAIEGRLFGPGGIGGHIVAISRGDAKATTTRSKSDGSFRFDGLIPGAWWVGLHDEAISSGRTSSSSSGRAFRESDIKVNCTVIEGQVTQFTLTLSVPGTNLVEGSLMLDGKPASEWSAALTEEEGAGGLSSGGLPTCTLSADGSFKLQVKQKGTYQLLLRRTNPLVLLYSTVSIGGAPVTRHLEFQTGSLHLTGLPRMTRENPVMIFVRGTQGGITLLVAPEPGAEGSVLIEGIPVIPAELILLDRRDSTAGTNPLEAGKVLAGIELVPGETVEVAVPD